MRVIWKFELTRTEVGTDVSPVVEMPRDARILFVGAQHGVVTAWALVDPDVPKVRRAFEVVGTGHPVPNNVRDFLGSVIMHGGALVLHVFEAELPA